MLSYFPVPYEDELWYSVLCRYHIRSGNAGPSTTIRELFGSPNVSPSVFYVNQGFGGIFERLPKGLLDRAEIYQNHTLIPYTLRFSSAKRKQEAFAFAADSKAMATKANQWQGMEGSQYLRYCPVCLKTDEEKHGEPYWRRMHQIPLMPLCTKHKCRLEDSTVPTSGLGRRLTIPTDRNCPGTAPRHEAAEYENALTETLQAFCGDALPDESGFWCSVLMQGLRNAGLAFQEVEAHLVWEHLQDFYSSEFVGRCFRQDRMQQTLYRMLKGQWTSPEQYALLAVCLGLDARWLTRPGVYIEDTMESKLQEMAGRGYVWKKQRVAEELGITSWALDSIIKRLGIQPFWKTFTGAGISAEDTIVRVRLSREEKARYMQRAGELGTADLTEYIKYCLRKDAWQ